jgi:hypothetical protein
LRENPQITKEIDAKIRESYSQAFANSISAVQEENDAEDESELDIE